VHAEEGHEEFDAQQLREHEEFTKVRNILTIELGRHEMDTWYFSPFPPEYKDVSKLYFCEVRTRCKRLHSQPHRLTLTLSIAVHARLLQAQGAAAAPLAQERAAPSARG
jgi:MYST family zinc finger domain